MMPDQVPVQVRKGRNRVLRELAAEKNLEFRKRFVGGKLSVVTLSSERRALSHNYIQVELARPYPENELVEVELDGLTLKGLREKDPLRVL